MHLVDGMNGHPAQRSLGGYGVVVTDSASPVFCAQARQYVGEHASRVIELPSDVARILERVPIVVNTLLAAHRCGRRTIKTPGSEDPLALHQQHVSNVATVLER